MGDTDKGRSDILYEEWVGILMLSFSNHRYHTLLLCFTSLYFDAIRPISLTALSITHFSGLSMAWQHIQLLLWSTPRGMQFFILCSVWLGKLV